jgi:hypothetical protein
VGGVITDAHSRQWFRVLLQRDDATGGECFIYRNAQHRRVTWQRQRPNRDAEWVETYAVDGIASQFYHSAEAAIAAMRSNP